MRDARIAALAGQQFNRMSYRQLTELGLSRTAIEHRVRTGRFVAVEEGVFAIAPVLEHDEWGRWMGATLAAPNSNLSNLSAASAWGFWGLRRPFETVTRPGNGGPRRHGGLLVYRSTTLDDECTTIAASRSRHRSGLSWISHGASAAGRWRAR